MNNMMVQIENLYEGKLHLNVMKDNVSPKDLEGLGRIG